MFSKQQAKPVFRTLIEEAKHAIATRSASGVTREQALSAMSAAMQEISCERSAKDDVDAIEVVEEDVDVERYDDDSPTVELTRRSCSVLELQLSAPVALPEEWDDGPFASDEYRVAPSLLSLDRPAA